MIKILVPGALCACAAALRFGSEASTSSAAGSSHRCHVAAGCESVAIPARASVDRAFAILAMR
jgi:hypothetical protein